MNLNSWKSEAKQHWKEFTPKRYKALVKLHKLGEALQQAAEQTHLEMCELEDQGYSTEDAWQMTREKYLFPPEEPGVEEPMNNKGAKLMQEVNQLMSFPEEQDLSKPGPLVAGV
ncbi:hypothetical protein [Citrobacter enshiensis]|uniref:hypothetical protein n=1 Tax=Citrobacter enshiensis TaxID=2971264 RepID=UPI0023E76393|nr:hypothetical protein [Citrobacter enshiensis]WET39895.1 hypothetical protein P2W74_18295 [Citrobacter enshiensis]